MSDAFPPLVQKLYDVALDSAGWGGALQALAQAFEADNAHLMVWAPTQPQPSFSETWGIHESVEVQYETHYGVMDPRRLLVAGMGEGEWFACHHRFDQRSVNRSEFWQDFLIPGGSRWLLGTRLTRLDGSDVFFGMHRAPGRHAFDSDELAAMRRLTGHFQRAARSWLRLETLREQAAIGAHALDAVEHGVIALADTGRVVYANRVAEAMLRRRETLQLRHGVLTAGRHGDAQRLRDAVGSCLSSSRSSSLRLGAALVTVLRRPPADAWDDGRRLATVLVLVSHPQHRRAPSADQLIQMFALTPAEARLARALAAAGTLESYAHEAGLSMATVKTQLRMVLRKTGTARQAALIRLLGMLPAVRHPNG